MIFIFQANSHQIQIDSTGGMDLGTSHLEFGVDLSDINIQDDFDNNPDGFGSLMDVFVQMTENSPPGSPRHASNPGSPGGLMDLGRNSPTKLNGLSVVSSGFVVSLSKKKYRNLPKFSDILNVLHQRGAELISN